VVLARQVGLALLALALAAPAFAGERAVLRNGFAVRHERREALQEFTRLYLRADNDRSYIDVLTAEIVAFEVEEIAPPLPGASAEEKPSRSLEEIIAAASDRHLIDADLIRIIIAAESRGNPRAVSPKGARGLMQLMPETAAELGVVDAFDPETNVEAGTRYLRMLLERYQNDLVRALAAYNAGPERVRQHNGVPPYHETMGYVSRIVREFNRVKLAARKAAQEKRSEEKKQATARAAAAGGIP
jgi:soluble lytic murein transglycosylase-like protein